LKAIKKTPAGVLSPGALVLSHRILPGIRKSDTLAGVISFSAIIGELHHHSKIYIGFDPILSSYTLTYIRGSQFQHLGTH
jgi:hypothetical protein